LEVRLFKKSSEFFGKMNLNFIKFLKKEAKPNSKSSVCPWNMALEYAHERGQWNMPKEYAQGICL
jgi:hypothetical protein